MQKSVSGIQILSANSQISESLKRHLNIYRVTCEICIGLLGFCLAWVAVCLAQGGAIGESYDTHVDFHIPATPLPPTYLPSQLQP